MGNTIEITLKRSLIKKTKRQRAVVRGLGLRKLNHTVIKSDTPEVRGMINKVGFLLDVKDGKVEKAK